MNSCGVALLLLIDVSGSIDTEEYNLQKDSYIEAFTSPKVEEAVTGKQYPTYFAIAEWAGKTSLIIPWVKVDSKQDLLLLSNSYKSSNKAEAVFVQPFATVIGQALISGIDYFSELPCKPEKKVIDISGDGTSEDSTVEAVLLAEDNDIVINGLPITIDDPKLDKYYKDKVITSNGFIIVANSFKDFTRALIKKLVFELS